MSVEITMSSPIPSSGFEGGSGAPNSGGTHVGPYWFNKWGMDLRARAGTEVRAAFDGHVTKFERPQHDSSYVYGAQFSIRSDGDVVGAYYTHLEARRKYHFGDRIRMGEVLGTVMRDHLHLALVEIVKEDHHGIDLYNWFLRMGAGTPKQIVVTFYRDGQTKPYARPR